MLCSIAVMQGKFCIAAQYAGAEPRRAGQHARAAVYTWAVPFHGGDCARLNHKNAGSTAGYAAAKLVDAFPAQRAAAH